jgi:hypothetical protein
MNMMLRETLSTIRQAGFQPEVLQRRHLHIVWTDALGRKRRIVVSRSPSDWRAGNNHRRILHKLLGRSQ